MSRFVASLLAALFAAWALTDPADANKAADAADPAAQAVGAQASGLRDGHESTARMGDPLLSSVQMKTLDGSKSFDTRMSCPSSNAFLTLQVLPDLATGNLISAVFNQDTKMTGTPDYSFASPYVITGVCANGLISCTTCGASASGCTGCSYYLWTADQSGKLGLSSASLTQLGGCYCINQSCVESAAGGVSPTLSNIGIILHDLGGGAVAAVQSALPNTAVSAPKVDAANMSVAYFGQSADACAKMTGASSPAQYYGAGSTLDNAASAEQATQAGAPNSVYTMAANAVGKTTGGSYAAACDITRNFGISTTKQTVSGSASLSNVGTAADVQLQYVNSESQYHFQIMTPPMNGVTGDYPAWTDLKAVDLTGMTVTNVMLCGNTVWSDQTCNSNGLTSTSPNCYPASTMPLSVSGCNVVGNHRLDVYYNYSVDYQFDAESGTLTDRCQVYQSDPNCRLQSETQFDANGNGVVTYDNFNPTGYAPLTQTCKTITTSVGIHTSCQQWWTVKRVYACTGSPPIDVSGAAAVSKEISSTLPNGSSYSNGKLVVGFTANGQAYSSTTDGLKDASSYGCEYVCKTSTPVQNTTAGTGGSTSQTNTSTDSVLYYFRLCTPDAAGNNTVCPISAPGETVVEPCSCPDTKSANELGPTAAAMGTLNAAAQDLICSDGTKK